jgi:ribosomal protein S18 acetylase RimI-like enzyme
MMKEQIITYREDVIWDDIESVREIVESSGFFSNAEIDVAIELVQEHLMKGISSGYYFVFVEQAGRVVGYTCFGPIPCTVASYDLHWIAVHNDFRGRGIGKELLKKTEAIIATQGGWRIYIDTASREQYESTRRFYLHCGYREEAVLDDFYAPGDGKVIYVKVLHPNIRRGDRI